MDWPRPLALLLRDKPPTRHLELELGEADESFVGWTGGRALGDVYKVFATDPTGGRLALQVEGPGLVVYFDSGGEIGIAAESPEDFLALLGTGFALYDAVLWGNRTRFDEVLDDAEALGAHVALVGWLREVAGVEPGDADEILGRAGAWLPDVHDRVRG